MHSTEDSEVPFTSFERLYNKAKENEMNLTAFIRDGNEHFVVYDKYFEKPTEDIEFKNSILNFLKDNFEQKYIFNKR